MFEDVIFAPQSVGELAKITDKAFFILVILCLIVFVGVLTMLVTSLLLYRRGRKAKRGIHISQLVDDSIEAGWTLAPLFLFFMIFAWVLTVEVSYWAPKDNPIEIRVLAKQWMWKTQHPGGQREINTLHIPINRNIALTMTSVDVIHSFYLPSFRVKKDVVPGRASTLHFSADKTGRFPLYCAEYCGTDHSRMGGELIVLDQNDYENWLAEQWGAETPEQHGEQLFRSFGCGMCHQVKDGQLAPVLSGLLGRETELADGRRITADRDYIQRAILAPRSEIVAGYPASMPSYDGILDADELLNLMAYLTAQESPDGPVSINRVPPSPPAEVGEGGGTL